MFVSEKSTDRGREVRQGSNIMVLARCMVYFSYSFIFLSLSQYDYHQLFQGKITESGDK